MMLVYIAAGWRSTDTCVTGPPLPSIEDDLRPFDTTPYSGTWWAGSPYRSFKDFMEHSLTVMTCVVPTSYDSKIIIIIIKKNDQVVVLVDGTYIALHCLAIRHDICANANNMPADNLGLAD